MPSGLRADCRGTWIKPRDICSRLTRARRDCADSRDAFFRRNGIQDLQMCMLHSQTANRAVASSSAYVEP